jgi:Disulphide bond corrector protein DsbC
MKQRSIIFSIALFLSLQAHAQKEIQWNSTVKKISSATYEIRLLAAIQKPWHIYAQATPEGGPLPTKITFAKNPLVTLVGKTQEVGRVVQKHEAVFDVDVLYYEGIVDFVQRLKLKKPIKTSVQVTIEYMICNDEMCLPPATQKFTLSLGE